MTDQTWLTRAMLWLSGADREALELCDHERTAFVGIGGTVATTTALAFAAATFTVGQFLGAPLPLALLIGVGWALAIMNLDRWLMTSIRRQATPGRTVLMAVPRLLLALVAGFLIAEPIVLTAFEAEVRNQAKIDKQAGFEAGREALERQYGEIGALERREMELEGRLEQVGVGAALDSPAYQDALARQDALELRAARAGRAGNEAVAAGLRHRAQVQRARVQAMESDLLRAEREAQARAGASVDAELRRVRTELTSERAAFAAEEGKLVEARDADIGLLDRVEALGRLTAEHTSMAVMRYALMLLILCIDALPAMAKVLMSTGRPTPYEEVLDSLELVDVAGARKQAAAYEQAAEISASVIVDDAVARKEATAEERRRLIRRGAEIVREAGDRFLDRWRALVLGNVDDLVDRELRRAGLDPDDDDPDDDDPAPGRVS